MYTGTVVSHPDISQERVDCMYEYVRLLHIRRENLYFFEVFYTVYSIGTSKTWSLHRKSKFSGETGPSNNWAGYSKAGYSLSEYACNKKEKFVKPTHDHEQIVQCSYCKYSDTLIQLNFCRSRV